MSFGVSTRTTTRSTNIVVRRNEHLFVADSEVVMLCEKAANHTLSVDDEASLFP